jgi:hypothetical protein
VDTVAGVGAVVATEVVAAEEIAGAGVRRVRCVNLGREGSEGTAGAGVRQFVCGLTRSYYNFFADIILFWVIHHHAHIANLNC